MNDAIEKAREVAIDAAVTWAPDDGAQYAKTISRTALAAFLASLRASGLVIEEDWREIESAPKDGTEVLLFLINENGKTSTEAGFWAVNLQHAAWSGWNSPEMDEPLWNQSPTHWRPLPAPPAMIAAEGK